MLLLRNDDLDPQRSKPEFVAAMMEDLQWLGILWQEGLTSQDGREHGPFTPYSQSARYSLYLRAWEQLRASGSIYPCSCSRRQLASTASAPHEDEAHENDEPLYPGTCRPAAGSIAESPTPGGVNWRFRVPDGEEIRFADGNLGPRSFTAGRDFGDFLIWRRDDVPAYQLAAVVDDAAMRITEVVRGADLLKSTARQLLLYRALGHPPPEWFHCELVRDESGRRLAKRTNGLSIRALRGKGLSPAEVVRMATGN